MTGAFEYEVVQYWWSEVRAEERHKKFGKEERILYIERKLEMEGHAERHTGMRRARALEG